MKKVIEIVYDVVERENLPDDVKLLVNASELALLTSHAPYSRFHVGASVLLSNGEILKGSNQENASFPIGYCAERTALAAKIAMFPEQHIKAIAISVLSGDGKVLPPIAPCGMCRQALLEEEHRQKQPIKVYLSGNDQQVWVIDSVEALLPFQFDNTIFSAQ